MTTKIENLTTGVISAHNVKSHVFDNFGIDPEYEAASDDAFRTAYQNALDEGKGEDEADQAADEAVQDFAYDFWEAPYLLYGDWKKDPVTGKYEEDPDGKKGYAAIFRPDSNVFQVVWSRYVMPAHQCSPCYPLQGDLDTPGDYYTCYTLPPDMMTEKWLAEHGSRYEGV